MDPNELQRVFQLFDRNGDGRISKKELTTPSATSALTSPAPSYNPRWTNSTSTALDEFAALYQTVMEDNRSTKDEEEAVRQTLKKVRSEWRCFITVEELRSVLDSLRLKQWRGEEDCRRMIQKVDADGDGMVNFQEF